MKHLLFASLLFAVPAFAQNCVVTGNFRVVDSRQPACFPVLDEAKCTNYTIIPMAKTVGASEADVRDAKKYGLKIMNYANGQACEGRNNCGFYIMEFATEAKCSGAAVENMPGGEYRGLTSGAARNIQIYANRQSEMASKDGKNRGDKTKNPKNKGKIWGAEE